MATSDLLRSATRAGIAVGLAILVALLLPRQQDHTGWSLFPPLLAILVAMVTGRLILGLSLAIVGAATIVTVWNGVPPLPWVILGVAAVDFVWLPLFNSFQFYILGFTASLIGMVRVIAIAGGTQGIAELLVARAAGARSTRAATVLMGLAIFFDDYANTMVVGTTMQPVADRFRISREKVAYLVDSTAAPVAGLAVISTWIGYEVGLFEDTLRQMGVAMSGYELFFRALPMRFYCIMTLAFVVMSVALRRDYGPMYAAERRAFTTGQTLATGKRPASGREVETISAPPGISAHWITAAAPIAVVVTAVFAGMHADAWNATPVVAAREQHALFSLNYWTVVMSNTDTAKMMFIASLLGSGLAFAIAATRRDGNGHRPLGLRRIALTWIKAIRGFHYAIAILVLAWGIKEACTAVGTSSYLVAVLSDRLVPEILPVLVFLLAAAIAFSIGTSWTTMAILLPTMVPVANEMGGLPLTVLTAAAVLDGAIFGDHCSPISDTTVLSSIAASCDHLSHVWTQIPYAVATMAAAALFGYLGTSLSLYGGMVGIGLGLASLALLLLLVGKDPEAKPTE